MSIHKIIPAVLIVLFSVPCFSQGWVEYKNLVDSFSLNMPSTIEPTVEEITWPSEYDAVFPGRIYTFQKDDSLYSVTVIDYTDAFNVHQARTNTTEADAPIDWQGDGGLLTRPLDAVHTEPLCHGGCALLDACAAGATLGEAAEGALAARPDADLASVLAQLLRAGVFLPLPVP